MSRVSAALVLLLLAACPGKGDRPARPTGGPALTTRAFGLGETSEAGPAPEVAATGTSPTERWLAGQRTFGVFSIHDAAHCDAAAWPVTATALGLDGSVVLDPSTSLGGAATVGSMTGGVVADLGRIATLLRGFEDSDIGEHHLCVVPATGVGVAVSTGTGFIAFVPSAIIEMNERIPDAERSMYSSTVAFAHELAHQFQFWYGDPFRDDKSARRTELAADCMGSAFVAMTQPSGWIMDEVERGAAGALQAFADLEFRSKQHHGTRADRGRMAHEGIAMVAAARNGGPPLGLAPIKAGCEQAVRAWDESQPLTPPDQLWGGTED